jgi:hypothetical protein
VPRIEQWCTDEGGPDRGGIGWLVAERDMTEGIGNDMLAGSTFMGDSGHMAGAWGYGMGAGAGVCACMGTGIGC